MTGSEADRFYDQIIDIKSKLRKLAAVAGTPDGPGRLIEAVLMIARQTLDRIEFRDVQGLVDRDDLAGPTQNPCPKDLRPSPGGRSDLKACPDEYE